MEGDGHSLARMVCKRAGCSGFGFFDIACGLRGEGQPDHDLFPPGPEQDRGTGRGQSGTGQPRDQRMALAGRQAEIPGRAILSPSSSNRLISTTGLLSVAICFSRRNPHMMETNSAAPWSSDRR